MPEVPSRTFPTMCWSSEFMTWCCEVKHTGQHQKLVESASLSLNVIFQMFLLLSLFFCPEYFNRPTLFHIHQEYKKYFEHFNSRRSSKTLMQGLQTRPTLQCANLNQSPGCTDKSFSNKNNYAIQWITLSFLCRTKKQEISAR